MKVPSTLEALEGTQKLLSDPARWCQKMYTNNQGAYCLFGALRVQFPSWMSRDLAEGSLAGFCLKMVLPAHESFVSDFNDSHTHTEVMELLSNAITFAKKKGL